MTTPSNACLVESRSLRLLAKDALARGDRTAAQKLEDKRSELLQLGLSTTELMQRYTQGLIEETGGGYRDKPHASPEYRAKFDAYVTSRGDDVELRDFLAGTQAITWTQGLAGGYLVPVQYDDTLRIAMAEVDPMLDAGVVDFEMMPGPFLQPHQISGYDLSQGSAALVAEAGQQNPQAIPTVLGATLATNKIFRASFAGSLEFLEDVPDTPTKIVKAGAVYLARKIGNSIMSGKGGSDINGVAYQIGGGAPTQQNGTSGKITVSDIQAWYFSIDRYYRSQPKCGWLMSDGAYKMVRLAVDSQNRPLLDVERDGQFLMGKPVHVAPGLGHSSITSILTSAAIFGDLSNIVVKGSRPLLRQSFQAAQADITQGKSLWTMTMRADAAYFDPSQGVTPPCALIAIN